MQQNNTNSTSMGNQVSNWNLMCLDASGPSRADDVAEDSCLPHSQTSRWATRKRFMLRSVDLTLCFDSRQRQVVLALFEEHGCPLWAIITDWRSLCRVTGCSSKFEQFLNPNKDLILKFPLSLGPSHHRGQLLHARLSAHDAPDKPFESKWSLREVRHPVPAAQRHHLADQVHPEQRLQQEIVGVGFQRVQHCKYQD